MAKSRKTYKHKGKILLLSFVLILLIFFVLILTFKDDNIGTNDVIVTKLDFDDHINDNNYVVFDFKNPSNVEKSCTYEVITILNKYKSKNETILPPKSEKNIRLKVEFPPGVSKVDLIYTCRNSSSNI